MSTTVRTEKELATAIEKNKNTIIIEGDLRDKVVRIKATGKVAWLVCIGAIGVAVAAALSTPATGGISAAGSAFAAPVAIGIIGMSATATAISIAVAARGVGVLNKLRKYNFEQKNGKCILINK